MINNGQKHEEVESLKIFFRNGTSETYLISRCTVKDGMLMFKTTDGDTHLVPVRSVNEAVTGRPDEKG